MTSPNPSTQQLVSISEIREDVVLLKDGSMRAVIEVSAINFELRSEEEQTAIIQNFQSFINSIDYPLQICIISRLLSINEYIKLAEESTEKIENELLKIQAIEYIRFVKELSSLTSIMSKKFYIIIPHYVFETPSASGFFKSFKSTVSTGSAKKISSEEFDNHKNQLLQRAEIVFGGLIGLGLKTTLVKGEELEKIFYELYNPTTHSTNEKNKKISQ